MVRYSWLMAGLLLAAAPAPVDPPPWLDPAGRGYCKGYEMRGVMIRSRLDLIERKVLSSEAAPPADMLALIRTVREQIIGTDLCQEGH